MAIKYEYDPKLNIVHIRPYGEHSSFEALTLFETMINDDEIKTGFMIVVHYENVENFLMSSNDGRQIVRTHNTLKDKKKLRAVVFSGCEHDIQYGMARMMQILHDLNDPTDDVFVTRSEGETKSIVQEICG